ncbi:MAG TPA: PEP-CTERM sorting domain-containing protein, partial [Fimbriimonas sp.]|nr:PEP-CTERM sorting domain-containing protein [Fimbriimonas sp.]
SHRVVAINSFVLDVDGNNDLFNFGDQGGAVALKSYEGWIESHINPVPEPTSMAALGLGIVAFLRKRSKSSK